MNSVTGATLTHNWAGTEFAKKPLKIIGGIGLLGLAVAGAIFLYLRSQNLQCIQPQSRKVSDGKKDNQSDKKIKQENKDDTETLQEQINQLSAQHLKLRNQEITKRENLILLNSEDLDNRYNQDICDHIRKGGYKELAKFPRYEVAKPKLDPDRKDDKDKLNYEKHKLSFKINKLIFRINYLDNEINSKLPNELKPIYEASNQMKLESVTIASENARFSVKEYKNIESISFTKKRIIIGFKDNEDISKLFSLKKRLITEYKVQFEEKKEIRKWQYASHESLW